MGGLEVASLLVSRRPQLQGAVLSGPALRVPSGALRLALGRVLSWVAPRMQIPSGISPDSISREPQVVADYMADPLIPSTLSVGLGAALIDAARGLAERGSEVEVPLLIVHGEADTLCDVEGSRAFHARVNTPGSSLRTYPALRHEVFNEPERESVLADVAEWLEKLGPAT
jgi:alpha-beta hydrolase superfamily lysophospholipase